jgi:GSH-dependent disulfide-bond oxidoreductase
MATAKKTIQASAPAIQVYSWATPNGHKVHIMLEECGFKLGRDWEANPVNIGTGEQFKPEFLNISPNNRIPALVDMNGPDGKPISIFESGAILLYLAAKTGKYLPKSTTEKFKVMEWLMFQMGGVGPMLGQNHHFRLYAPEPIEYAINRYTTEAKRLYGVMDRQLAKNTFIAGKTYSIADIAIFPWLRNWKNQGVELSDYPHVQAWFTAIEQRPAVIRGCQVLADLRKPFVDTQSKDVLFGIKADSK